MDKLWTPLLLVGSNIFMTYAWYGHLKDQKNAALWLAVVVSWGVAFFEYCLQVPANRMGAQSGYSLAQLKVMQEVITMVVFVGFSLTYLGESPRWNHLVAFLCILAAVFFGFMPSDITSQSDANQSKPASSLEDFKR